MPTRIIVNRAQVLAAQGLVELAEMGVGEVGGRMRAIAAARWVPGTEDDYEVLVEDQPA